MVCMGPRTRHALRDLKVKVSNGTGAGGPMLGSVGDFLGKELGKRGWEGVRSCSVGVPVFGSVGTPGNSRSGSESEASGKTKQTQDGSQSREENGIGKDGDKDITKLVAKVGRWWWGRCYDSSSASNSLFTKEVLEECDEWRTSLKLYVGVARKMSLSSSTTSARATALGKANASATAGSARVADVNVALRGGGKTVEGKEESERRDEGNGYRRAVGGRGKGNSF